MRARMVAAPVALLRLAFLNPRRKSRKLLVELGTSAVRTGPLGLAGAAFQKLTYPAAVTALILKNRHSKTPAKTCKSLC